MSSAGYVQSPAALCQNYGCQLHQAQRTLDQARELIETRNNMSAALWCDQGGHAFSERDPGRQRITVNTLDENEQEAVVSKDFCGDCAVKAGLTSPRRTRPTLAAGGVSDG